jgi:hypothetical protein
MASRKPKPLNSGSAKSNKHPEPESLMRPEGGTQAGTAQRTPAVAANSKPRSLCARKFFVAVLTVERGTFVRGVSWGRNLLLPSRRSGKAVSDQQAKLLI